ncbi:hypothetical protein HPB48_008886 [Haemaphysalis longicornis]|uniref:C2H2-type domain-containing protein n=1 Tax=Haemaphysalis longicornis TaxID=44386 RepID=A0A9J6H1Z4_HAELO|nr:hypothetical protein HPB48_008886 [Haemaphysalis longicornis]
MQQQRQVQKPAPSLTESSFGRPSSLPSQGALPRATVATHCGGVPSQHCQRVGLASGGQAAGLAGTREGTFRHRQGQCLRDRASSHPAVPPCSPWRLKNHRHPDRKLTTGKPKVQSLDCILTALQEKPNVTTHEMTHTGGRPFSCRVCGKRFTRRNTLDEHLTVHTKERPYGCPDCGRRYTHPRSLSRHRMLHKADGKPLACRFCARGFRDRYHLAVHLVTHTGERPHACRVCGQAFSQLGNARDHERRRHPDWRPPDTDGNDDDEGHGDSQAASEEEEQEEKVAP